MKFSQIQAQDGCVIFFPSRSKGKPHRIISGPQKTRTRWGEEWVQLRLDLVTLEVRLEDDNAVNLGNELRSNIIAKLVTHVDDSCLDESLPKLVDRLRCSTTPRMTKVMAYSGALRHPRAAAISFASASLSWALAMFQRSSSSSASRFKRFSFFTDRAVHFRPWAKAWGSKPLTSTAEAAAPRTKVNHPDLLLFLCMVPTHLYGRFIRDVTATAQPVSLG